MLKNDLLSLTVGMPLQALLLSI